jgi:hypothetical protein
VATKVGRGTVVLSDTCHAVPRLVRHLVLDPAASQAIEAITESDILPTVCMG